MSQTSDPDLASDILPEIKERFIRMQEKRDAWEDVPAPARELEILGNLERGGFPERHRGKLMKMRGPSLIKAEEHKDAALKDALLVIIGDRGPGKTQMAVWWAFQRGMAGKSVGLYVKSFNLCAEIKDTWAKGALESEAQVIQRYRKTGYLVIDEFQEKSDSAYLNTLLVNLIDHRYDAGLVTVLAANYTEAEALASINPSILSRAQETGGFIVCNWPSYREENL